MEAPKAAPAKPKGARRQTKKGTNAEASATEPKKAPRETSDSTGGNNTSAGSSSSNRSSSSSTSARGDSSGSGERGEAANSKGEGRNSRRGGRRRRKRRPEDGEERGNESRESRESGAPQQQSTEERGEGGPRRRRRRGRPRNKRGERNDNSNNNNNGGERGSGERGEQRREQRGEQRGEQASVQTRSEPKIGKGLFIAEKGGFGTLRDLERQYIPSKHDIFVSERMVQRHKLRDGSIIEGPISRGKKYKYQLEGVTQVDGKDPQEWMHLRSFKSLTTIDPDFHYAVGDVTDDVSMRILDLIAPIGRGQRGLIVAQPRTGKTTLMRQFAKGIEMGFPEVHLMVLLVDERPEEATDWVRSTGGQVFVSTSDETPKNHVQLAEAVWKRCQRLVEMGEDVVLILDSITRLARAYNNSSAGSGRTMSGGLDSRAMERPRQIFGSARNTETAGSLTILGTALIDTGSRMDQLIFEEFKGTGNMEVMLNRKLADRRIFPAIDIEKSGTRKEEKLVSSRKLKRINTLRRVLLRMNFIEAMELLSEKLLDVEKTDDFLKRFDVDPEA